VSIKREIDLVRIDGTPTEVASWGTRFEAEVGILINEEHYVGLTVDEAEAFLVEFQNALEEAKGPERALEVPTTFVGEAEKEEAVNG
jgi:hypothetical protein